MKSGDYYFKKAIYPQAIRYYEKYLAHSQDTQDKIPVWMALARSWAKLGNCSKSLEYYELTAQADPLGPRNKAIQNEIFTCSDFFPLEEQSHWEEVDSQTLGQNMFAVNDAQKQPGSYIVRRKIYAGKNSPRLVHEAIFIYSKEPGMVWERLAGQTPANEQTLALRFPYEKGAFWTTKRQGRWVRRTITDKNIKIQVAAGRFDGCLEVMEESTQRGQETIQALSGSARIYDTYCPGIGRVKSMVGQGDRKEPHSELLLRK